MSLIMSRHLTTVLLVLFKLNINAQMLNIGFNSTDAGRNITVQYEKKMIQNEYSFGLGVNINMYGHPDNQNNFYRKRLYATKWHHYFNADFTYQMYIFNEKTTAVKPFVFYDLQAKYSTTRNQMVLPYTYDSTLVVNRPEDGILYRERIEYFGPFWWLENNIGIGFTADITDRIYIKQRIGMGVDLILGYDDQIVPKLFTWWGWEFSGLIHTSIGIRLNKK